MVKTRRVTRKRGGPAARSAFSLVEMMIALLILGFGLLVVGASLPIGLEYSRKSADMAVGEAAAEYGLDVVSGSARLSPHVLRDSFFRPRFGDVDADTFLDITDKPPAPPEQPIKVRSFSMRNVDATPDAKSALEHPGSGSYGEADGEILSGVWYSVIGLPLPPSVVMNAQMPAVTSSAERVFPPLHPSARAPWQNDDFSTDAYFSRPYLPRPIVGADRNATGADTLEMRKRLIAWTAFYRQASPALLTEPEKQNAHLYEVIVVATRRPSELHRFARQDYTQTPPLDALRTPEVLTVATGSYVKGQTGPDRVCPTPWLVVFKKLPQLPVDPSNLGPDRSLPPGTVDSRSLEFLATYEVAQLLPPGSVFIPAVNNITLSAPGFVPHSPDTLPIYEVIDRKAGVGAGADWVITVKNNGLYPWVAPRPDLPLSAQHWPVWVIPPAMRTEGNPNNPRVMFDNKSPIIGIARRFVRFPEIR